MSNSRKATFFFLLPMEIIVIMETRPIVHTFKLRSKSDESELKTVESQFVKVNNKKMDLKCSLRQ